MQKQKIMQASFVSFAIGGPKQYTGRTMKNSHHNLHIEDKHFDLIVEYLGKALIDKGMSEEDV